VDLARRHECEEERVGERLVVAREDAPAAGRDVLAADDFVRTG
jgi:hypothetical protein